MKWTMKPITWGAYFKLSAIVTVVYAVGCATYLIAEYHEEVADAFKKFFCKKS